jgi:hypothetical protein
MVKSVIAVVKSVIAVVKSGDFPGTVYCGSDYG